MGGNSTGKKTVANAGTAQACPLVVDRSILWHALTQATGAAVMVIDLEGRVHDANEAAGAIFRRKPSELCGRPLTSFLSEAFSQVWLRRLSRCVTEHQPLLGAMFLNGVVVRESLYPFVNESGVTPYVLCVLVRNASPVDFCMLIPEGGGMARRDALGRLSVLTNRELEILALIGQGMRTKEMASRLVRSERTLHGHCAAIARKLRLKGRADMAALASAAGLIAALKQHS